MSINQVYTHSQKVCRLYKRVLRTLENYAPGKAEYRFQACLMRARFDETRSEKDMRVQAIRLAEAEEEHRKGQHCDPIVFKNDPGGICYRREHYTIDHLFDSYHPWEKAQLRDFFEQREVMKAEYDKYFEESLTQKYKPEPQVV
eukprot:TRINITY_DN8665_c0_g1_i1.p2 TRINITY_DN8665_c0_g1~~TRINITY_DN8665_c0_g1_i1.p2  ORF type:complete len:144 (-),score=30.63 TRINITY_DN8665_c0_g1_i1:401-832(-)